MSFEFTLENQFFLKLSLYRHHSLIYYLTGPRTDSTLMDKQTKQYYADNAEHLAALYNWVKVGVSRYFNRAFTKGDKVLDLGCGTGRDPCALT